MKTKRLIVALLVAVCALFTSAGLVTMTNARAAEGESYTLTFEQTKEITPSKSLSEYYRNNAGSTSAEAYGTNGVAITYTTATDKAFLYFGTELGLVNGKKYTISFKLKIENTEGTANHAVHIYNFYKKGGSDTTSLLKDWLFFANYQKETTFEKEITFDGDSAGVFGFLVNNAREGKGVVYMSDLKFVEDNSTTQSVAAGSAIGTLPEIPAKAGYNGYWTIDGEKITADTVYNYGADKTATIAYEAAVPEYTLTFEDITETKPSKSLNEYYRNNAGSTSAEAYGTNGVAIAYTTAADKAFLYFGTELGLVNGKKYTISFKLKIENTEGTANHAVHIYNFYKKGGKDTTSLLKDWLYFANYQNETIFEKEITFDGDSDGVYGLLVNNAREGYGVVYMSDFKIVEDNSVVRNVLEGGKIGELPEVPEKAGYEGVWTIDGEEITAETVYNYGANKTAVAKYTALETYELTFTFEDGKTETRTVIDGAEIGELPEIPQKKGHKAYWAIDGKAITSSTAYGYGANKTANVVYEQIKYTITFDNLGAYKPEKPLGEYPVFDNMSDNNEAAKVTADGDGVKITILEAADGKGASINLGNALNTVKDKYYRFHITMKLVGSDGKGTSSAMRANLLVKNGGQNIVSPKYLMPAVFGDWNTYSFEFKAVANGQMVVRLQLGGSAVGDIYVKDIYAEEIVKQTVCYGDTIELPEIPEKEFYTGKWMLGDEELTDGTTFDYEADQVANIVYTPIEYELTFVAEGNVLGKTKYTVETPVEDIDYPEAPDKDGHKAQWEEFDPTLGGNRTINAFYDIDVTVTFKTDKGETVSSSVLKYGSKLGDLPEITEKIGYKSYWSVNGEKVDSEYVVSVTSKLEVVAVYEVIEYKITFYGKDGVKLGESTYTVEMSEKDIQYPEVPAVDGSTEGAWETFNIKNGGDVSIYYEYTKTTAQVTFVDEDGHIISSKKVKLGEKLGELPEAAEKEGFTVIWTVGNETVTEDTVITEDVAIRLGYKKTASTPDSGTETEEGCLSAMNAESGLAMTLSMMALVAALVVAKKKKA